jgi:hypothetical protein
MLEGFIGCLSFCVWVAIQTEGDNQIKRALKKQCSFYLVAPTGFRSQQMKSPAHGSLASLIFEEASE